MRPKELKLSLFVLIWSVLFLSNCKVHNTSFETELLAPLVKTKLNLNQIINDEEYEADSSGLVHLIYRTKLYDLAIDSFFEFNDTSLRETFRIDSLSLYSTTVEYPLTLGTLARNAGPIGQLLLLFHGFNQTIPAIPSISAAPIDISADTIFTTMTLEHGTMELALKNGLPIDVEDIMFELRNKQNNELVISGSFPLVPAGGTVSESFDLAGKTVEGQLVAQLQNLSSPGSKGQPVLIDTNNFILASLKVYNLHPSMATAIWPKQNLINDAYYFALEGLPVELKESRIASGTSRIRLSSTLEDSVRFVYKLLTATLNGVPFERHLVLPPAPKGGSSQYTEAASLKGYHFDFSGDMNDSFNVSFNQVVASIDSTGIMKSFSKQDSIFIELSFENLKPEYARGYLNDTTLGTGRTEERIELFERINSGNLELDNAKLGLHVDNKVGVDFTLYVNEITSLNNRTGKFVSLNSNSINSGIVIPRAKDAGGQLPIVPGIVDVILDAGNSNITEFISNLPDRMNYDIEMRVNPMGNTSLWNDFIYDQNFLQLDLDLDIPVHISARGLMLSDTVAFSLSGTEYDEIQEGVLHAFFKNDFPFETALQIYLLSENGSVSDSLFTGQRLIAAAQSTPGEIFTKSVETRIDIPVDRSKIDRLLKAKSLAVHAVFDTKPEGELVKIYDQYYLEFQLTADFIYLVE